MIELNGKEEITKEQRQQQTVKQKTRRSRKNNRTVIGIAGKVGSGKSFISEYIARETGFELVKLDYHVAQIVNKPILKQMLQRRIKNKIPKAYQDIQLFPLWKNLENDFSAVENALVIYLLNRKLKRIIKKSKKSVIVDFTILPVLKTSKKFDGMYLVKSDEEARISHLSKRDRMTYEEVQKADRFMEKYYEKSKTYPFDGIINNCYMQIPNSVKELIASLKRYKNTPYEIKTSEY